MSSRIAFEEKMVLYQKRIEEKSKKDLEEKMQHFKESELSKMRLEERDRQRKELFAYKEEIEKLLNKRAKELSEREKLLEITIKEKREREERELFYQRQQLLNEIKEQREREADYKKSLANRANINEHDSNRFERFGEELKRREERLNQAERDFDIRLKGN